MVKMYKEDNLLVWGDIESATRDQAAKAASLPFVHGHIALMPDAHVGKGSTIGSVIPTKGAIIPSAIGVDIGCGMIAAELPFTSDALGDDLSKLHSYIASVVPSGMGKGHASATDDTVKHFPGWNTATLLSEKQMSKTLTQFGTLGGGNHFVEVCLDERDIVWVVLHSGSRGVGNELANIHIDGAKNLMKRYFIDLEDPDLAYLVEGTPEFAAYIRDMLWAQSYALGNREVMMDAVLTQMAGWIGHEFNVTTRINCHHNYTERENHNGQNVWLTRKGAIRAREGDLGVIPGSMGTMTYIVEGKGSAASYHSSSHGAGRAMSRAAARKRLDVETFESSMGDIAWNGNAEKLLDEDPRAYKDIHKVMEAQHDLVETKHVLRQVLNYKGTT